MAHKTDTNLTGKVGIAEGLISRSVTKTITVGDKKYNVPESDQLKDITWKDGGQGEYKYTEEQEKPQQKDIPINSAEIFTADRVAKATLKDVVKGRFVYVAAAYNGTNEKDMTAVSYTHLTLPTKRIV